MKQEQPDANATIQLDRALEQLDEIQLDAEAQPEAPLPRARLTPPPLPPTSIPPGAALGSLAPRFAPAPKRSAGKTALIGVVFVALLAVAIAGGWKTANAVRPTPQAPPPAVVQVTTAPAPAAEDPARKDPASASSTPAVLTLPTIEMNDVPADPKGETKPETK